MLRRDFGKQALGAMASAALIKPGLSARDQQGRALAELAGMLPRFEPV